MTVERNNITEFKLGTRLQEAMVITKIPLVVSQKHSSNAVKFTG